MDKIANMYLKQAFLFKLSLTLIVTQNIMQYSPILWPLYLKSRLIGKDSDAGKDWGQEEKGATEDEMVGWHHRLNGHEFEQTLGDNKDREAWCVKDHGLTRSWTRLSDGTTNSS